MVPLNQRADIEKVTLERPGEDEVKETTEKTREALEKIVQGKLFAYITCLIRDISKKIMVVLVTVNNRVGKLDLFRI